MARCDMPEESPTAPQVPVELLSSGSAERAPHALTRPIAVVIADGQALFRSGLARLLEEDPRLRVVAVSGSGVGLVDLCLTTHVDVLVTDVELPDLDVQELLRLAASASPSTRVLVLGNVANWRVLDVMAAGASGFLLKDTAPEGLRSAVVAVHSGEQVLSPQAALALMNGAPTHQLTPRESTILRHVALGSTNREIAEALHLREKTVRNYVSRLYRKLPSQSRAQMASFAFSVAGPVPRGAPRLDGGACEAHDPEEQR